jgi:NADH-quinone oxidoreductase subunit L
MILEFLQNSEYVLSTILLAPLISALMIAMFLRRRGTLASVVSVGAAGISMLLAVWFLKTSGEEVVRYKWEWMNIYSLFTVDMGYFVNAQAKILLFVVTFVGFLIHVFSVGYMNHDADKGRFFGGLSIFMFSMLGIVLADNLFMLYIFWELVGFSSYMLIAHYISLPEARMASKKAFIVNRIGDFGFLIGIVWAYAHFYWNVNLENMADLVRQNPSLVNGGIALLLMCGFIGKSAQFPLHVWLPDAMAGPTPVSALIHAATMVAAGIYMLCRIEFLFPEEVKALIMWLGAVMTAFAGFCALGQRDIKKILAYSTLSQLGYMATAFGLGYSGLALFHLSTHAFFKALLFLGAGSVIHACHHEQDIFKMGGLLRKMPLTGLTFIIGTLALCGVTFTAGYFSKDAIIEAAYLKDMKVFWLVLFSAFLTSVYMGRLIWIAFFGEAKSENAEHVHESSFFMVGPLLVLAGLALVGGYVAFWPHDMAMVFEKPLHMVHEGIAAAGKETFMFVLTIAAWVVGLLGTYVVYGVGAKEDVLQKRMPVVYGVFASKFWFDDVYNWYVEKVQNRVADLLSFLCRMVFDFVMVHGTAICVSLVGFMCRGVHVGSIHGYVFWFGLGLVVFGAYALGVF